MPERFREWLLDFLRVPRLPTVPPGADRIRVFRAAPVYFRYRLLLWALAQLGVLGGFVAGLLVLWQLQRTSVDPTAIFLLRGAVLLLSLVFLAQLLFTLAALRLDFEMRWYILADRSLRIREGILSMREKTMTFANIQQITIRQNPLQRLLGIADVNVRSAGGGGSSSSGVQKGGQGETMHEAFFRGVDNAEEIRAAIRECVRQSRDAGLGDPEESRPTARPVTTRAATSTLGAARELHAAIRDLAAELQKT